MTIPEAKRHLGVTSDDKDLDIESLIYAAQAYLTRRTGLTFVETGYRLDLAGEDYPEATDCPIELPSPPVQSVQDVEYYNEIGVSTVLAGWQVVKSEDWAAILPAVDTFWPAVQVSRARPFWIEYTAGPTADSPPLWKHAVKLLIRHWYDNASAVATNTVSRELELSMSSIVRSLGRGFYANV